MVHTRYVRWAKLALVSGLLALLSAFWLGVDYTPSAALDGRIIDCDPPAIPMNWLMAGSDSAPPRESKGPRTAKQKRVAAACAGPEHRAQWLAWGLAAIGGIAFVGGWTGVREHDKLPAPQAA